MNITFTLATLLLAVSSAGFAAENPTPPAPSETRSAEATPAPSPEGVPSAATVETKAGEAPPPPSSEEKARTERMLREENLGGLRLEMAEKQVIKLVGKPKKRGKLEMWEAIGTYMQAWNYPDKGVELQMTTGVKKTGAKEVFSITAEKGCKLATKGGIKIGSTEEEVRRVYGPFEDKENPPQGEGQFVAGSLYGGITFDFKDGKVSHIFFGAGAE